ncbi:E3 ubiquitin-protein ligase [Acorus calamus]|uniref:RING-type E3 ubiquitin transferase n=1 Tax=Acorus calamus TaxID=4465 RepID=A0AAV9CNN6_ACOCL|nr:E3 ubiquitin-protein ligase [Acorus calamus]
MGGCCCSARRADVNRTPLYYYCPPTLEEHEPLSTRGRGAVSAISAALLVDTNLDTSSPDTYRAPPPPLPYDVCSRPDAPEIRNTKADPEQTTDPQSVGERVSSSGFESLTATEVKEGNLKKETDSKLGSPKVSETEISKLNDPIISDEEDVCPTCLEEYDAENPRIITKCEHHFHLSCILEWLERSDTCPVCDQLMIFNHSL